MSNNISEASFQKMVIQIAQSNGWKYYHPPDNIPNKQGKRQNIVSGYPDLTLVRGERLIFAELKRNTGYASKEQKEWIEALSTAKAEAYIWKPKDLHTIIKLLK